MFFPNYFINESFWAEFWLSANDKNHNFQIFKNQFFQVIIYEYPFRFGQKFWYISKAPNFLNSEFGENDWWNFLDEITEASKKAGIVYLKMDFDHQLCDKIPDFLQKLKNKYPKILTNTKSIQYLATMTLEIPKVDFSFGTSEISNTDLEKLFLQTKDFWQKTNENIRRYTKKSLTKNWQITTEKSVENFEFYYQIYKETSLRQKFAIQPKKYLQTLFEKDFIRIIILKDQNNQPQAVWLGILSDNTLTYLSGGNTEFSFKNYGQYIIHLVAAGLAVSENMSFYDLGGYDERLGFSKFKDGYRGKIRKFVGPYDLVFRPEIYYPIMFAIKILKKGRVRFLTAFFMNLIIS
jgi:lipid II:glycine glycyltransferase (peptidoglycan interpeptide bridge formation enzyme)